MSMSRRKKLLIGASALPVLVILAATALLLGLRNTDPISKQEAIDSYEKAKEEVRSQPADAPLAGPGAAPEAAATTTPRANLRASRTQSAAPQSGGLRAGFPAKYRPDEGLYSYDTDGGEKLSGISVRRFPPVTRRAIIHRNAPQEWSDYHEFLSERKTWGNYRFSDDVGRMTLSSRQYVEFYTQKQDRTIVFDPPVLTSPVPWQPGQTWKGSYDGKVYGTYTGRSELRKTTVGGRQIEVWSDILRLEMHGEVEGVVNAERWLSPETGLTVFEHYVAVAKVEAFDYSAEWTVRIRSLEPEHS